MEKEHGKRTWKNIGKNGKDGKTWKNIEKNMKKKLDMTIVNPNEKYGKIDG